VLYRSERFREKVQVSTAFRFASDKPAGTKLAVVVADAGPLKIQWREGAVLRCAGDSMVGDLMSSV
jgi:hypothetical protein